MSTGVIYVLTNPSFKAYVKIGYTNNIEERLKQLNRSECIPFAFRVYCTYEVDTELQDKVVHHLIDILNPALRSIETIDGKLRVREFFAITAENAYAMFESIARISGTMSKLKKIAPNEDDLNDEVIADRVQNPDKPTYTEQDHLEKGSTNTKQLYSELKQKILALGSNITVEPQKYYLAFKTTSNFCDVEIQKKKLMITINMKKGTLKDPLEIARDMSNTGHWGNGDYEISLLSDELLDDVMDLIKQSYEDKDK